MSAICLPVAIGGSREPSHFRVKRPSQVETLPCSVDLILALQWSSQKTYVRAQCRCATLQSLIVPWVRVLSLPVYTLCYRIQPSGVRLWVARRGVFSQGSWCAPSVRLPTNQAKSSKYLRALQRESYHGSKTARVRRNSRWQLLRRK